MTRDELLKIIQHAKDTHVLNISGSQLTQLPTEIGELVNLRRLNVKHNQLNTLPREIGNLVNLRELWLDGNQIEELPREIGNLRKLRWLSLNNNRLQELPHELLELIELEILELSGNEQLSLPPENLTQRPQELLDYMVNQQEKQIINEARLMVLGNPGAGKTALIRRMIERTFDPAEKPSNGIHIQRWPLQVGHKRVQLNIWDFGHQEVLFNLYRLFMSPRTVYLLVWEGQDENHRAALENWLKLIQYFGDGSPAIVAISKTDRGVRELNRYDLQKSYPFIREFINTSASEGDGIHDLRDALKRVLSEMENTRTRWQKGWLNIKTRLEISRKPTIESQAFADLCDKESLSANSRAQLLQWLNDLGVVTHFSDDLRNLCKAFAEA